MGSIDGYSSMVSLLPSRYKALGFNQFNPPPIPKKKKRKKEIVFNHGKLEIKGSTT